MSKPSLILELYSRIAGDTRVNVWHISLYMGLLDVWRLSNFQKQFKITRKLLMDKSHFKSITTYHKCIEHLKRLGYIVYLPTYDSYQGSLVEIKY